MSEIKFEYTGIEHLDDLAEAKHYNQWILNIFKPYLKGTVIEVGSGIGSMSELFLPSVSNLVCIEPDEKQFEILNRRFAENPKVDCIQGFFHDLPTDHENVDCVVYINVLEHIEDHFKELEQVKKVLCKGGTVCIFVPALPLLYGEVDKQVGHYRRYLKKDFRNIAAKLDMDILKVSYFDSCGIIPWYISTCLLKNTRVNNKSIRLYDSLVVPFEQYIENIIPPFVGKNIYAVFQVQK